MGNTSTKLAEKCALLSREEIPIVAGSFKFVSKNSERIKEDDLMKFWGSQMDPRLAQYITNFLFGSHENRTTIVEFQRFAELYVFCVRGTVDDRINVLLSSLGHSVTDPTEIAYPLIKEYVEAVVSSYMRALRLQQGPQYKSWESKGFRVVKECVQKLAESLAYEVVQQGTQKVTRSDAERWLQQNPTFLRMLEHVFMHLFNHRPSKNSSQHQSHQQHHESEYHNVRRKSVMVISDAKLLPFCEGLQYVPDYPAFTDISQMLFINANLPVDFRHKWRFLFSSQIHGESFSTFIGRIVDQGASVIIVEDTDGYIYGGFAPVSWTMSPKFVGNDNAYLFTLRPKMRVFGTTGYNDHYQYLNLHQQTMPNGLGMGGQHNYWGLWLDSDYGKGECSETCTTFRNYTQLGINKKFTIRNIEVWGVGEKPVKEQTDSPERSVLDGNVEEKAILEMAGRQQYSDGFRDEPLE